LKASTGLLLLTNREEMCAKLLRTLHPSGTVLPGGVEPGTTAAGEEKVYGSKYEKVYLVRTSRPVTAKELAALCQGVMITTVGRRKGAEKRKRVTMPCKVILDNSPVDPHSHHTAQPDTGTKKYSTLLFHLREGRNRQIRKMLGSQGNKAAHIHRVSFAGIDLDGLQGPGDLALLTPEEAQLINASEDGGQHDES
jgi:16S rRNA U516 pseudouridylate synthase RsuA-like enzyme